MFFIKALGFVFTAIIVIGFIYSFLCALWKSFLKDGLLAYTTFIILFLIIIYTVKKCEGQF